MSENNDDTQSHLTAEELLYNKGICSRLVDEYNQVSRVLPKTGVKVFEPNGSWLQNKQIDTCLETRKDVIKVERVNRLCALAVAEWLPNEKRAIVTKKSGVEWNNYGNDIRGNLYLIPEEALLLLELNCLELLYDGLPLSIQQAYELLINSSNTDCTLNEYRVFSQLARLGYRLQRFHYDKSMNDRNRNDDLIQPKKKFIIDPDNGRWMSKIFHTESNSNSDDDESAEIQMEIKDIVNDIIDKIELTYNEINIVDNIDNKIDTVIKVKVKPRVEIVSEETVFNPVKLVVADNLTAVSDDKMIKWSGARIQRNVKLLPKRVDKKIPLSSNAESLSIMTPSKSTIDSNNYTSTIDKRKAEINLSSRPCKKLKQEIIELSDDDIEEIPRSMTRMEMLNCIPNIATNDCIKQTVLKQYIPIGIKPLNKIYKYDRERILRIRENIHMSNAAKRDRDNASSHLSIRNSFGSHHSTLNPLISSLPDNNMSQGNYQCDINSLHGHKNNHYTPRTSHITHRHYRGLIPNNYMQNNMMNLYENNCISNFWSSFQVKIFRNIAMMGILLRSSIIQNKININETGSIITHQDHHRYDNRRHNFHKNQSIHHSYRSSSNTNAITWKQSRNQTLNSNNNMDYGASFVKMSANSWSELKKKWKESKTITIDEDDDKMDCSEVEVVQCNVQPLININNVKNYTEIYDRLRIIKSAQSKIVRKKRGEYKISYRVYSNTQHYRKSNPGKPIFHLAISNRTKNFLQPIDLSRLQQDSDSTTVIFAYVTDASITFMQAGLVTLPNLKYK